MTAEEQIRAFCEDWVAKDLAFAIAQWEYCYADEVTHGVWHQCSVNVPRFSNDVYVYRRKPRTFRLGNVDVPLPLEELPNEGRIFIVLITEEDDDCLEVSVNYRHAEKLVRLRVAHTTKEAAILHSQGFISANRIALGLEKQESGDDLHT